MNFKEIHIGKMIEQRVSENNIELLRITNFMKCTVDEIKDMYKMKSLDSEILLRWSKLLDYDFFRLYSQHLILYAPPTIEQKAKPFNGRVTALPQFRKNIYTKEVIDYIIEQVVTGKMTKNQVIERYKIPKTTLYKWISKYSS